MPGSLNYFQTRDKISRIDVDTYLSRIGLERKSPDLPFLKALHKAHLHHIPFENLDIHYNKKIVLDINKLYQKVVLNNRGGICYELNALLYHLLGNLRYRCQLISANVWQTETSSWTPDFDHVLVLVELQEALWIADVGFGQLFMEPKKLVINTPQLDYNEYYVLQQDPDERWILKSSHDNASYKPVLRFDTSPKEMIEFIPRCNYHQESAGSHFKQNKILSQAFRTGRITLTDNKLKMKVNGEEKTFPILNEDEFLSKASQHFGIDTRALITQGFD